MKFSTLIFLFSCAFSVECLKVCPRLACPADMNCPNGYDVDKNGCKTCTCKESCKDSVCLLSCKHGLKVDDKGCKECECHVCPMVCAIYCEYGNVLDANGCKTCNCKNNPVTCPDVFCIMGGGNGCINTFEIDENGCTRCVCKPYPECPMFDCPHCPFGYVTDAHECQTCECIDPCKDAPCKLSENCVPDENAPQKYRCVANCCPKPAPPKNCSVISQNKCQSCLHDCSLVDCVSGYNCCPDWFGCYTCVKSKCSF